MGRIRVAAAGDMGFRNDYYCKSVLVTENSLYSIILVSSSHCQMIDVCRVFHTVLLLCICVYLFKDKIALPHSNDNISVRVSKVLN